MALEGTIKDFGLPDIFQLIGLQRKTGILTLKHEKDEVTVTFENGMVVTADSSTKRLEDRLGNVLVKQGKLTKERLDEALQTQKATLQRLGHVLTTAELHHAQGPEGGHHRSRSRRSSSRSSAGATASTTSRPPTPSTTTARTSPP